MFENTYVWKYTPPYMDYFRITLTTNTSSTTNAPKERTVNPRKEIRFKKGQERRALALCAAHRVVRTTGAQTYTDELLYVADYLVHGERQKRKRSSGAAF